MDERKDRVLLTEEQEQLLIADLAAGMSGADASKKYSVSTSKVAKVKANAGLTRNSPGVKKVVATTTKTLAVPTTQKQLDQAVLKLVYEHAKVVKTDNQDVEVDAKIRIGDKTYSFEELMKAAEKKKKDAETQKEITELKARLEELEKLQKEL